MSLPPPPNPGQPWVAVTTLFTSLQPAPNGEVNLPTLEQIVAKWGTPAERWEAVRLLRLARLKLHGWEVKPNQFQLLPRRYRAAYRVGRLSEVGMQLKVRRIRANPHHIDQDWFGERINVHWWNDDQDGRDWERTVTRAILRLLEDSLGLGWSGVHHDDWTWPDGLPTGGRSWAALLTDATQVPVDRFSNIILEWDYDNRDFFATERRDGGTTLRIKTPMTIPTADIPKSPDNEEYPAAGAATVTE